MCRERYRSLREVSPYNKVAVYETITRFRFGHGFEPRETYTTWVKHDDPSTILDG
jgi:hypothetical protein